jgi:hypothetical protein
VELERAVPAEVRFIVFSQREVAEAVRVYTGRKGKVVDIDIDTEPEFVVRLRVLSSDWGVARPVAARGVALLEALFSYCGREKIPLPRLGKKKLSAVKGRIALHISLDSRVKLPTGAVAAA